VLFFLANKPALIRYIPKTFFQVEEGLGTLFIFDIVMQFKPIHLMQNCLVKETPQLSYIIAIILTTGIESSEKTFRDNSICVNNISTN
jgi:hypothetical protein